MINGGIQYNKLFRPIKLIGEYIVPRKKFYIYIALNKHSHNFSFVLNTAIAA